LSFPNVAVGLKTTFNFAAAAVIVVVVDVVVGSFKVDGPLVRRRRVEVPVDGEPAGDGADEEANDDLGPML
jgi:hypothetical protein